MAKLNKTPLQIRAKRGTEAQITATPAPYQLEGEIAYATDTKQFYISDGTVFRPFFSADITTKTSDYTATIYDYTILADGTSNTVTITLPTAVGITGRIYNIKCIDDTSVCDVDPNGTEEIDGVSTNFDLINGESITIQSDGANWWII